MSAQIGGQFGRGGLVGVEAGARVDGLPGLPLPALLAAAVDAQGEFRVGEGDAAEVLVDCDGLDRAGLAAAVSGVGRGVLDGDGRPAKSVQLGPGAGLVGLDGGDVLRLLGLDEPGDVGLHRVQRVESDHVAWQVERCQEGLEVRGLVGLASDLGSGEREGPLAGDGGQQMRTALANPRDVRPRTHLAGSSLLLAPDTAAAAQISRIDTSEY